MTLFQAQQKSAQQVCSQFQHAGFSHVQYHWKQKYQTECAITPFSRGQNLPSSFHIHSKKICLPLVYLCLSVRLSLCLARKGCPPKLMVSGGEQSNLPTEGNDLRCWYISHVFYVLLSIRSHVEIEIFLFQKFQSIYFQCKKCTLSTSHDINRTENKSVIVIIPQQSVVGIGPLALMICVCEPREVIVTPLPAQTFLCSVGEK